MKIILFLTIQLLSLSTIAKDSTASFSLRGEIKPILQLKVTQVKSNLYTATVTSNNPNGFRLAIDHDGVLNPQDDNPSVSSQTIGGVYSFPLRFSSPPTYLNVSILAD